MTTLFKQVIDVFTEFDNNSNGVIDREELFMMMEVLDSSWTEAKMELLWESMDSDGSGSIQYEEFLRWIFRGMGDEEQEDFREAVAGMSPELDAAQFEGAVTVEARDGSGNLVYGPSEILGSTAVSLLRRRIKTSLGKAVGCLIQANGIPLRDSLIVGAYANGSHLSVTVVTNALSLLTPECVKNFIELKALTNFSGNDCIRIGRVRPLRIGEEAAEFMLAPDGRIFAKGYRCTGYVDSSFERDGNPRAWTYEMVEGTFTIIDLEKCIVEITWRRRAERKGRDAGRGMDPLPLEVALDEWESIEDVSTLEDCDGPKLVPLVSGVANILQLGNEWLKPRRLSQENTEEEKQRDSLKNVGINDGVPKGFLRDEDALAKVRDPLGGIPMPEISRDVLYDLDFDDDTEVYWCHGINDEGPFRKYAREHLGY